MGPDETNAIESEPPHASEGRARRHREVLAVACAVVILAFVLVEVSDGRVAVRGFTRYPLPESCFSRSLFGLKCPGCGLTRSIIHLAEGDWQASWGAHRLGGLMAAVIVFQVPYRLLALRRPDRPLIPTRWLVVFGYVLIGLLIGNWLVDLVTSQVTSA
jgi:ethanolamine transporter EutH